MSPNKTKKGGVAIQDSSPEAGPSALKRQRSKMSSEDEDDVVPRKGASGVSKATSSKYGSHHLRSPSFGSHNKPAELFRKDLISAMKLADSEPLQEGSYFLISDPWRQEWEKGVQVPVNMSDIMQADIREVREKSRLGDFKIPHKLLHERADGQYKKGLHELTGMAQLAELLVRYDLDDLDVCWLEEVNFTRQELGLPQINEWNMERVMEELENQCHEKMTAIMKTEEGLGIEYDEDVVCDVCRSPESEDTNEMVFCDGCDICIHQACYGIQSIPEGSWLCRTCALGIKPRCILCPQNGGAMKSTRSGTKWAHVSCALWIPEVSIGVPEKMEPITKISNIPPSRWALCCSLCKERVGACIQCSVKTCKTAFHVTCGFQNGLEMKTVLDETDEADGVKLKAYCAKHTKKRERGQSESDVDSPRKEGPPTPKKELTQQEKASLRAKKLKQLEEEFYKAVDVPEVARLLQLDEEIVDLIYVYWKLKRKSNWDRPLLTPRTEEAEILEKQQEDSLVARMKMFVHLRQDLERVRNLCYMIGKREKMKQQFFRYKEYVFAGMVRVLLDKHLHLSDSDVEGITENYHFNSVYDDYGRSFPQPLDSQLVVETGEVEGSMTSPCKEVPLEDVTESGDDSVQHDKGPLTSDITMQMDEESQRMLARGERWSGEFVRSGFFKRRRHKKWIRGPFGGVSKVSAKCAGKREVRAGHTETEMTDKEDSAHALSADESEVDRPLTLTGKVQGEGTSRKSNREMSVSQPLIPKIVLSPKGKTIAEKLRVRRRKRQRGRKPWHVKKLHHAEIAAKIGLVGDEEIRDEEGTANSGNLCKEAMILEEMTQTVAAEVVLSTDSNEQKMGSAVAEKLVSAEPIKDHDSGCLFVSLAAAGPQMATSNNKQSRRDRSRHRTRIHRSSRWKALSEDEGFKIQTDESNLTTRVRSFETDSCPVRKTAGEEHQEQQCHRDQAEREAMPEVRVDNPLGSRQQRKTLFQTRLNMNKALSALAESSDDDFEPKKQTLTSFSRKRWHSKQERRQSVQVAKQHEDEGNEGEVREEVEVKDEEKDLASGGNPVGLCDLQQTADQSWLRQSSVSIRPEIDSLLRKSKLTVKESVKEKVQNRLLKSRHRWRTHSNGVHGGAQMKIDNFCKIVTSVKNQDLSETIEKLQSKKRVLHEMNPERDYGGEKNIFGAHYTPRGSLSGYKIPKKSSQPSLPTAPSSPLHTGPACKELVDLQLARCRLDGSLEDKPSTKKSLCQNASLEVDTTSTSLAGHFSGETVSNCHGYRTKHSPLSSEGSSGNHAVQSDSRESTPRRVTRSQLTDELVENAPSPSRTIPNVGGGGNGGVKMRLKESWLRAAHFST